MAPGLLRMPAMRVLLVLLWVTACDQETALGVDAGNDAGPVAQGSPARGELVVNEVSPRPATGADWIELANRSDQALDLCGYFVTDDLDRLDHYAPLGGVAPPGPCEPVWLEPGGYLVIHADDGAAAGPEHAPFRLGEDDQVHVVPSAGAVVDSLIFLYPAQQRRTTLARSPDREGLFHLAEPTPGAPNPEDLP